MPGFMDKLKEGKDRAAFEADRQRRLIQAQSSLRTHERQMEAQTAALGRQALALWDAGGLTQPELETTCQALQSLRERIAALGATVECIRQERLPVASASVSYGHICPRCQTQLPPEAAFCSRCGGPAADMPPPQATGELVRANHEVHPPALPATDPMPEVAAETAPAQAEVPGLSIDCPMCGISLSAEAVSCPNCDTSLSMPAPEMEESPSTEAGPDDAGGIVCPACEMSLPAKATFCFNCGEPIAFLL